MWTFVMWLGSALIAAGTAVFVFLKLQRLACPPRCCRPDGRTIRLIPIVRSIVEQTGPVAKTPQYQTKGPVQGDLLMGLDITATQDCVLAVDPDSVKDAKGNKVTLEEGDGWSTDNSDVLALTPNPNNFLECKISAIGPVTQPGQPVRVFLSADGKTGAGVAPAIGSIEVNVGPGNAVTFNIGAGTPTEQQP